MKSKLKAARIACFTLGTALLMTALFLVIHNVSEDRKSGRQAKRILQTLKDETPEYTKPVTTMPTAEEYDLFAEYEDKLEEPPAMETITLDGNVYIGYINIPEIGIELPVLANWSYPNLKIAPCRYVGSINTDDLIICAHNYTTHFGRIGNLHTDSEIIITDTAGKKHEYSVVNIEQFPGTAVEDIKFGNADDWDLTLFTCTLGGQNRVTVRAVKIEE